MIIKQGDILKTGIAGVDSWFVLCLIEPGSSKASFSDVISVCTISLDTATATDDDVIVEGQTGLPKFMVEVWNRTPMLVSHVSQNLGKLNEPYWEAVCAVANKIIGIESIDQEYKKHIGPPIEDINDTRINYQSARCEAANVLGGPAFDLLNW